MHAPPADYEFALPCRLAYPMPPAGADPDTWVPEEEPQPIGITVSLPQGSILPGASHQHCLPTLSGILRNTARFNHIKHLYFGSFHSYGSAHS